MVAASVLSSVLLLLYTGTDITTTIAPTAADPAMALRPPTYTDLIRKLYNYNIINPVKMGLDNSRKLYQLFGRPLDGVPIVHVAGTNGKGSVSLKTAETLRRSGLRTGLFVSPHISSFRERIQVNGESLAEDAVLDLLPQVFAQCEQHTIPATFFELTCALAFVAFGRAQCDAVVLEVGLGGRLDSTNVITPQLCVITSIQLDHTKILGDTIDKIAMEKAGIMKPGVDVLVGPGCPIELLRAEAMRVGAPFYTLSDVLQAGERTYKDPAHDADFADIDNLNTDISRAALRLLRRSSSSPVAGGSSSSSKLAKLAAALAAPGIEDGLQMRPPCRFEVFPQTAVLGGTTGSVRVDAVLDIAHNEDAMVALARKVSGLYPSPPGGARPLRVVLGMSSDKDIHKCLAPVLRMVQSRVDRVTCVAARHPRAIKQAELRQLLKAHSAAAPADGDAQAVPASDALSVRDAVAGAVRAVAEEAAALAAAGRPAPTPLVVVCGTAFIMAEARAALGVVEPRDGDTLTDAITLASAGGVNTTDRNADAQEFFGHGATDDKLNSS